MKKENFVQLPIWLLEEFSTITEIKLFAKMYNGWCLMKDADGWYYRAYSKLKSDAGINPKDSNTKITKTLHKFEELGFLRIDRNGRKTNRFSFDEGILFNHIGELNAPKSREQNAPKQDEGVGSGKHPIYNTKENILKENMEKKTNVQDGKRQCKLNDDNTSTEVYSDVLGKVDADEEQRMQAEYLQWIGENTKNNNRSGKENAQSHLNNGYVTHVFEWLDDELNYYFHTKDKIASQGQDDKICSFIEKVLSNRDKFTDKQWDVVCAKVKRWQGISASKAKFYERLSNEITPIEGTEQSAVSNEQSISIDFVKNNLGGARQHPQEITNADILTAMDMYNSGGCAAPQYKEEEYQQAVKEVCNGWTMGKLVMEGMETTIEGFRDIIESKLNAKINWEQLHNDVISTITANVA